MFRTPLACGVLRLTLTACDPPPAAPAAPPAAPAAPKTAPAPETRAESTFAYAPCTALRKCTDCDNSEFITTDCLTTPYGPAKADVVTVKAGETAMNSPNMLRCDIGSYAMCFYSGPPSPTNGKATTPLPCELNADGTTADCTCRAFTADASADTPPYFVDIHGIRNLQVYFQTIDVCGTEGQYCANIANCPSNQASCDPSLKVAPVCSFVANQKPDAGSAGLIPGAQIISTFSFAMNDEYVPGSTDCTDPNANWPDLSYLYAGCMTAGCSFEGAAPTAPYTGQTVQCACPTWRGPYQVGQNHQSCGIEPDAATKTRYVWSASYTVSPEPCDQAP